MKKIIKTCLVLSIVFSFIFLLNNKVNAEATTVVLESGASLRATGKNQGIKFIANSISIEDVTEQGFYVIKGEATKEEIIANGVKAVAPNITETFSLVIYGMDAVDEYVTDLSVVAYIKTESGEVYTELSVTRSIAEVAYLANNKGVTADLITSVIKSVSPLYKLVYCLEDQIIITSSIYNEELDFYFAKIGDSISIEKEGYNCNGWSDGTNSYGPTEQYVINENDITLIPDFVPVVSEVYVTLLCEGYAPEDYAAKSDSEAYTTTLSTDKNNEYVYVTITVNDGYEIADDLTVYVNGKAVAAKTLTITGNVILYTMDDPNWTDIY